MNTSAPTFRSVNIDKGIPPKGYNLRDISAKHAIWTALAFNIRFLFGQFVALYRF